MIKWCERCPNEYNSCDECKKVKVIRNIELTKDQKKKLREKAKEKLKKQE